VLNSPRAVQMSVFVVRAFVKMRAVLSDNGELARKLASLEKELKDRLNVHEAAIVTILQRVMAIIDPPALSEPPPKKGIGFQAKERKSRYRTCATHKRVWMAIVLMSMACSLSWGQGIMGGSFPEDPSEIMSQIAGTNRPFSATVQVPDPNDSNAVVCTISYAILGQRVRCELTLSGDSYWATNEPHYAEFKRCGLHPSVTIHLPDREIVMFPGRKACVETPASNQVAKTQINIRKWETDREVVDGHPCIKYNVLAVRDRQSIRASVWEATDLGGFPICMKWTPNAMGDGLLLKHINLQPPSAALFVVPEDYRYYPDFKSLVKELCPKDPALDGKQKRD
jgi:hypothetical protein